jgi:hypothetical protein
METEFARPLGHRLARQAYPFADARRFVAFPRRDLYHPATPSRRANRRSLRRLPSLPRRLPDGGDRRSLRSGRPPVHLVPHDRIAGAIPVALRPLIGNRIYGCDDCQLCCPWNRFAHIGDPDFAVRNGLDAAPLTALFAWNEEEFNARLAGSAIRRIGHLRWLRNIAVALGNAPAVAEQFSLHWRGARMTRRRCCASMSAGRWRNMRKAPGGEIVPITDRVWSALPPGCAAGTTRRVTSLTYWDSWVRRHPRARPSGCSASDP